MFGAGLFHCYLLENFSFESCQAKKGGVFLVLYIWYFCFKLVLV